MSEPITILLVDDDENNLDFLERTFRNQYKTLRAKDGEEAFGIVKSEDITIIITDQRMPRVSGTELLERSLEVNSKIIKIILSAYTDTSDILSAINVCRINHYLVKPVSSAKLLDVVEKALELLPEADRYGR